MLLLRLRQACCHPHLINDFEKVQEGETPTDQKAHVDKLLDGLLDDIRRRLIERGSDAVECPICMDVGEESVILSGCGHIYCRACIVGRCFVQLFGMVCQAPFKLQGLPNWFNCALRSQHILVDTTMTIANALNAAERPLWIISYPSPISMRDIVR